ncbi:YceI family protein [Pedobacter sp. KBW06]|uniref:YceI family protein n=1 Tax=Pedobacter sp. KBW06 TaxID=2153359 RepID=UPI000F5A8AE3|nr:YceI family protein [Pedobacter sp. KBW06]RQO69565.1 YceI family protein [Pedobacter sp. KBW06]
MNSSSGPLIRPSLLLLLILLPSFAFKPSHADPVKWILTKECTLKVNGSTNINKFSCIVPEYVQPDTLICYKENKNGPLKISGSMALDVQKFDCKHAVMTNDLRKTLKAKVYPKIIIKFLNLSKYPDLYNREEAIKGAVTIELAGIVKHFEVDYKYTMTGNGNLKLIGTKQVNFSDFNISPPRKLGGMIKTNNELNVEFVLNIKTLN